MGFKKSLAHPCKHACPGGQKLTIKIVEKVPLMDVSLGKIVMEPQQFMMGFTGVLPIPATKIGVYLTIQALQVQSSGVPATGASLSAPAPSAPAPSAPAPLAPASSAAPSAPMADPQQAFSGISGVPAVVDQVGVEEVVERAGGAFGASGVSATLAQSSVEALCVNMSTMSLNAMQLVSMMHTTASTHQQGHSSLHPTLQRGVSTIDNLSWTLVGFDATILSYPAEMDIITPPLPAKYAKDLQDIQVRLGLLCSGVQERAIVVRAWQEICRKALEEPKFVYGVVMTHAWLNRVPLSTCCDTYWGEYLFVEDPDSFDFYWHLRDFVAGVRKVLVACNIIRNVPDVSRMPGVSVPVLSLKERNMVVVTRAFPKEKFDESKFVEGCVPVFRCDAIMENHTLSEFSMTRFPQGTWFPRVPGTTPNTTVWYTEGRNKFFMVFSGVDVFKLPGGLIQGEFVPGDSYTKTCTLT